MDETIFTINSGDYRPFTIGTIYEDNTIMISPKEFTIEFDSTFNEQAYKNLWQPFNYRAPYVKVPDGRYHPRNLGLNLLGVDEINVGECAIKIRWPETAAGHSHDNSSVVCIKDGHYVIESPGKADEVLRHEQAHALAGPQAEPHGSEWIEIAKRLGIENPQPNIQYTYAVSPEKDYYKEFPPILSPPYNINIYRDF